MLYFADTNILLRKVDLGRPGDGPPPASVSPSPRPLQPLVEGALQNELRLLEAGVRRSDLRLQEFEAHYGLATADFVQRYENGALEETLEFAEWIGEYRLRERLLEKTGALRVIRFAD